MSVRKKSKNLESTTTLDANSTDNLVPDRANWGNPIEFILACVGYAVGLGNVWRFPSLVFRNGGGAFLVPYVLMIFGMGLPIFFCELVIGQYSGLGPIKTFARMSPIFHGLGYCTLLVILFLTIYYMVIIAWILFYFFASFGTPLKWGLCNNDFNTDSCYSTVADQECRENNTNTATDLIFWLRRCMEVNTVCQEYALTGVNASFCFNATVNEYVPIRRVISRTLATEEYYNGYVLGNENTSWTDYGVPKWDLVLCLLLAWIIAFFCVIKGIQSAGKVVYFTALFPYVILIALLIRGTTLEGAGDGVEFYIKPDWERLKSASVWGDAASQIFYSFGIGCGSLVTLASYNKFNNNCHFDACIVSLTNAFTAIFAGFAVFSILGFMAFKMEVPVDEVVNEGPGLAFIAYPEAVLNMPWPNFWAIMFFFMMIILGLGSQFAGIESINTAVIDRWPHLRKHQWRVTAGTCLFCFIAAIPMVCEGGVYMFTLMDWHSASWAILLVGFAEVVVVAWVYGFDRVWGNINEMDMHFHIALKMYWMIVWKFVTPVFTVAVFIFILTDTGRSEYNDYVFPAWADAIGWMIGATTLVPFPVFVVWKLFIEGKQRGWDLIRPTSKWGPAFQRVNTNSEAPTVTVEDPVLTSNL